MDLLIIPVLAVTLWKARFCREGSYAQYLSVENTRSIRGILALLVVLHHLYMETGTGLGHLVFSNVGVLCVALFLFFSGYGLQKSFEKKPGYGKRILTHRIPAIAVPFVLLIFLYWALYDLLGTPYTPTEVLRTLVSGSPIVRYGWYTQCLLLLYLLYYLCTLLFGKDSRAMAAGTLAGTLLLTLALYRLGFAPFWYYPILAFPAGIIWAVWEVSLLPRPEKRYLLSLGISFLCFGAAFAGALTTFRVSFYWAATCAFLLFILLILRKFAFHNPVLAFLGDISFEIYSIHGAFLLLYRSDLIYLGSDLLWGGAVLISAIPAGWLLHRLFRKLLSPGRKPRLPA